jgi:heptosyltransferase-3
MRALLITSNRLGDAVLTTGAVDYLHQRYPGVRLTVACGALPAPLFEAMPEVAEVWRIQKRPYNAHWWQLWKKAAPHLWQHVVDLRGSAFAFFVLTARRSVMKADHRLRHRVLHLTDMLQARNPVAPVLRWRPEHSAEADRLLGAGGPWIAIGPTANWVGKQWHAEGFASVARTLTASGGLFPNARVLVAGAPSERSLADPILQVLPKDRTVPAFGWPLPVLAAALSRMALYIGNDSGLMHMAAAVGVPTIGLFGPSKPELYAPWGPHTAVVRTETAFEEFIAAPGYNRLTTGSLMGEITPEAVLAATRSLLESSP